MLICIHKFTQTLQKDKQWFAWSYEGSSPDEGQTEGRKKKSRADSGQLVTCPVFPLLLYLAQWPHAEKSAFRKRYVVSHFLLSTQHQKGRTVFESQLSLGERGLLHVVATELP